MAPSLRFPDAPAAADVLTFARRAATLPDPAIRLIAARGVLVLSTAVLAPRGLADRTPTVLALRTTRIDPELETDLVVDPGLLLADPHDATALTLPPTALRAPWAGISPPTANWLQTGTVAASTVATLAHAGVAEVAQALPVGPGDDVVRVVRGAVWARASTELDGIPAGAAFAALALGFIGGAEDVRLFRCGPWRRLTLARGHVLVREPIAQGLTVVRATGR